MSIASYYGVDININIDNNNISCIEYFFAEEMGIVIELDKNRKNFTPHISLGVYLESKKTILLKVSKVWI